MLRTYAVPPRRAF